MLQQAKPQIVILCKTISQIPTNLLKQALRHHHRRLHYRTLYESLTRNLLRSVQTIHPINIPMHSIAHRSLK